jgi:hypothetical protein
MNVNQLIEGWDSEAAGELSSESYSVRLPLDTAAKLEALVDLFPLRTREQFIAELLGVVLDEVVSAFPYVQGENIISRDEEGDPIYEDIGHTPRYLQLVHKHMDRLRDNKAE